MDRMGFSNLGHFACREAARSASRSNSEIDELIPGNISRSSSTQTNQSLRGLSAGPLSSRSASSQRSKGGKSGKGNTRGRGPSGRGNEVSPPGRDPPSPSSRPIGSAAAGPFYSSPLAIPSKAPTAPNRFLVPHAKHSPHQPTPFSIFGSEPVTPFGTPAAKRNPFAPPMTVCHR